MDWYTLTSLYELKKKKLFLRKKSVFGFYSPHLAHSPYGVHGFHSIFGTYGHHSRIPRDTNQPSFISYFISYHLIQFFKQNFHLWVVNKCLFFWLFRFLFLVTQQEKGKRKEKHNRMKWNVMKRNETQT